MNFDLDKEKKLDGFLKRYDPIPPNAKPGEYQRILQAVENSHSLPWWKNISQSFRLSLKWFVPVGAAAILTFVFWPSPSLKYDPAVEEAISLMMGPLPSAMHGGIEENWIDLAEIVSAL